MLDIQHSPTNYRSSPKAEVFILKDILKIFVAFSEKHPRWKVILTNYFQNLIKVTLHRGQFVLTFPEYL